MRVQQQVRGTVVTAQEYPVLGRGGVGQAKEVECNREEEATDQKGGRGEKTAEEEAICAEKGV